MMQFFKFCFDFINPFWRIFMVIEIRAIVSLANDFAILALMTFGVVSYFDVTASPVLVICESASTVEICEFLKSKAAKFNVSVIKKLYRGPFLSVNFRKDLNFH